MAENDSGPISQPGDYELIIEKDVLIPMRDGSNLCGDIYRPDTDEKVPVIFNISPYQKDKVWRPPPDVEEPPSPHMNWECASPAWWCPRGYAIFRVDTRGSGKSPGKSDPSSYAESLDAYDCVEWVAKQDWCNGNVGTLGISYNAAFQWRLANLQPPSLKAIIPWEGRADQYRDQAYHGGIFSQGFLMNWHTRNTQWHLLGRPRHYNPDAFNNNMLWNFMREDLDSEYWRAASAKWDKIKVPLLSAGNWGGMALHLRGNTEAFMNAASEHKKLRIHTGTHWNSFYSDEGKQDQLRFFDYWLKGIENGVMDEPPVKIEIRTGGQMTPYEFRYENEWPLARTQWTKLYLKVEGEASEEGDTLVGQLEWDTNPSEENSVTYRASAPTRPGPAPRGVSFISPPLEEDTEITGPMVMNVWISSTSEDSDIFATIRNIDEDGNDVCEIGQQNQVVPAVAKGWLRASRRKLDPEKTLPYRPYHAHDEHWWLEDEEPVECQVEIWPSCMVFKKGHRIRLDVTPVDGPGATNYTHVHADYNDGAHNTLYAGGDKESYLLLPVIPEKE